MGQNLLGSARTTKPVRRCGAFRRIIRDVAGRTILSLALIDVALGFVTFDSFYVPSEPAIRQASAAVVFTGAFERVDAGLSLLNSGHISKLYISGMNAGAGIMPARFVAQFALRNPNVAELDRLAECCIEWGEHAGNTFQNAVETKCWIERLNWSGSLLLITSRRHMARAKAALSGELPNQIFISYPVDDRNRSGDGVRERALEYIKYLATMVAVRLPGIIRLYQGGGLPSTICDGSLQQSGIGNNPHPL